jgi:mono/diheme cytochrome c family protein
VDVTASDIPASNAPAAAPPPAGGSGGGGIAGGSTDPMTIIRGAGCTGCHTVKGEGGKIGPDLTRVGSRLSSALIRECILKPDTRVAKGYEKFVGVMPKMFGNQLTGAQLEALVQFLSSQK